MPEPAIQKSTPSLRLYHYTSLSGLYGITGSGVLWATNVHYLNDSAEIRYATRLLRQLAVERSADAEGPELKCLTQLAEWIDHGFVLNHMLFVGSLTPNGNLLSQWRAYCPPGRGVSIGFNPDNLIDVADEQGFFFVECIYDQETHTTLVEQLLNDILRTANDMGEASRIAKHPSQSYYECFETHEDHLLTIAAQLKHPAFAEEEEWRAISEVFRDLRHPAIKFRDGPSRLIPYRDFQLPKNETGAVATEHVYMGPCPEPNLSFSSLTAFLTNQGASPAHGATNSSIPWRTW